MSDLLHAGVPTGLDNNYIIIISYLSRTNGFLFLYAHSIGYDLMTVYMQPKTNMKNPNVNYVKKKVKYVKAMRLNVYIL